MEKAEYLLSNKGETPVNICPVCGGYVSFEEYCYMKHVVCMNCGLSGLLYKTVREAVIEWNLLAAPAPLPPAIIDSVTQ